MSSFQFNTSITQLSGSSTFFDWFNKENQEIIAKLNLAKVADVTGGDGVLASLNPTTGLATFTIGGTSGTITRGLTFNGPVSFLGEAIFPNISYRIPGITAGNTGYTFGSVIRITTDGYTAAKANNPDSAEVIGVLTTRTSSYALATIMGKIDGDFSQVAGSTLSPGCVYFLSSQTAGNITTEEPNTIGYVSKPVIIGLGATSGLVIQYRGNYLNSNLSAGGGESGSNRLYIALPISPTDPRTRGFSAGSFLSYAPNVISGNTFFADYLINTGRTSINGWFLSGAKNYAYAIYPSGSEYLNIPREEDFIVGMVETVTTSGSNVIYQILTRGTSTVLPKAFLSGNASGIWTISGVTYPITSAGITAQIKIQPITNNATNSSGYQVGVVFQNTPSYWFINPRPLTLPPNAIGPRSATVAANSNPTSENYTFNGDFEIWQRTTGRTEYTTSGNVYFADAWIRRQSGSATTVQSIERKQFNIESTEVEGNPKYYVDVKCLADPSGSSPKSEKYSIGHIIEGINTFNGESLTVSFYAKVAAAGLGGLTNYPVNVYFARYSGGSLVEKEDIGEVNIFNTDWQKFNITYNVPPLAASSYTDDYVEIGLDFIPVITNAYDASVSTGSNLKFSIASFNVFKGNITSPAHWFNSYNEKLEKCQRYYFSTYKDTQTPATKTMLNQFEPTLNAYSFTFFPNSPYSIFNFPVNMRSTPSVTIYSPNTGFSTEVYNKTGRRDLRYLNGTKGFDSKTRFSPSSVSTISTEVDETSVKINLNYGVVPYDVVSCHIVADASYSI